MTAPAVADTVGTSEFLSGLGWGVAALIVALAAARLWRAAGRTGPAPVAGLALAAAAVAGLATAVALPAGLVAGLVILAAGGAVATIARLPAAGAVALAIPGAWVLAAQGGANLAGWMRVLVAVTAVAGAAGVADFDARHPEATPALLAITAAGVYATVPDTEQALVLLGAAVPLALLGWPLQVGAVGRAGACAAAGLVAWTAAAGGYGRGGAVVGAVASLGLLVAEPVGMAATGRSRPAAPRPGSAALGGLAFLVAGHVATVAVASRVAGLQRDPLAAAALAIPALLLAALSSARWSPS